MTQFRSILIQHKVAYLKEESILNESRGVRILSLDGGGMRGITEIKMLMELEKRTNKKIIEMFDIICGTSVGGIIALGMLCKIDVPYYLDFYKNLGNKVSRI